MKIDFMNKCEIEHSFSRVAELINTEIFSPSDLQNPFVKSAFIEVLICMRDLMYKVERYASRIDFTDDIVTIPGKVVDVTDLVLYVRNAVCHPESEYHYVDVSNKIKASYNIAYGKCNLLQMGDIIIGSDYEDDVCFFFGKQKIYLKRHIIRALKEAKQKLLPLL